MKTLKIFISILFVAVVFFSCKKDYTIGGDLFKAQVNMTTYDYLKTNHAFDTLVMMINKMNLKDEVNSAGTFFAVTNYSITNFVLAKKAQLSIQKNNENLVFTFDSLNFASLKDSLRAYMFKDKITRDNLSQKGIYTQALDGEYRLIQLRSTTDYTNSIFTTNPQYIYLTKVVPLTPGGPVPVDINGVQQVDPRQLLSTLCQTTGILTTTGVLHVLNNNHTFTYFNNVNN
ncbi:hypothetical protein [Mucilaginibacter lappiensis]|uniref:Fasciclin domain-containing protein n=1 Tax=Mucilaginibacter lappiensis TaxID=354630 RepID=A0A1N7FL08_9SPHI|nr:hypothetical protein [Mucilaginibacter lappiensis]MBB6112396.1 hypothetical protein [Mucilaginibacter lappiensis]MBB6127085.1 hypothetical protein [Mucilaginibacter lappiensis]SIS00947.1 hypothetical protein SAMN05421821_11873 [Mucilaginibacter lappiensis]